MTTTPISRWTQYHKPDAYEGVAAGLHAEKVRRDAAAREVLRESSNERLKRLYEQHGPKAHGAGSSPIGLEQLIPILVDMKRDIKKVVKGNCLNSATAYAANLTKQRGTRYSAGLEDLDEDGIPEVIIRDVYGNPVVVNGYTTIASKWPERLQYYTGRQASSDPSRVNSKGVALPESPQEWRQREFDIQYGRGKDVLKLENFKPQPWAVTAYNKGYKTTPHPPKKGTRGAFRAFQDVFLKEVWSIKTKEDPTIPKRNYMQVAGFVWSYLFTSSAFYTIYEDNGLEIHVAVMKGEADEALKLLHDKAKKDSEVKQHLESLVIRCAVLKETQQERFEALMDFFTEIVEKGNTYIQNGKNPAVYNGEDILNDLAKFDALTNQPPPPPAQQQGKVPPQARSATPVAQPPARQASYGMFIGSDGEEYVKEWEG